MIRLCRSPFINHSHLSLSTLSLTLYLFSLHNSLVLASLLSTALFQSTPLQSMEEVDDEQAQVQHHHHEINIDNQPLIHTTKPLTTTTTSTSYIYPPPETLDFPTIYSGIFFNSSNHSNHHDHHQQQQQQPYLEAGDGVVGTTTSTYLPVAPGLFKSCSDGNEVADAFNYMSNNNCSSSRWPREETMSLLQIRSRLHSSFKQATHKGPLWDEVSRIMYEENGYQRSGKKCREKFENLYKYYKKTKEAKSGKHDGKNYRFFRQLEALYGDQGDVDHLPSQPTTTISSQILYPPNSNSQVMMVRSSAHLLGNGGQEVSPNNNQLHNMVNKLPCDQSCLSLSNHNSSSHFTSSSSEENYNRSSSDQDKKKNNKKKLKMKIKEFINIQMKSLVEQQQLCMEKVMETIEQKEKERVLREEKWRQQAEERLEKEHKLWANERAWMKARDSALMDTLQKFTSSSPHMQQVLPAFSTSSIHPSCSVMNKKQAECSTARDPLALYNSQESQNRWFMASNHHQNHNHNHHHNHDGVNGFRVMMSDGNGNVNYGGSLLWDGSSFGLKLNNGVHDNHQN